MEPTAMTLWPSVVVGIGGALIAAAAGLTGGIIAARSTQRTANYERLLRLYAPTVRYLMAAETRTNPANLPARGSPIQPSNDDLVQSGELAQASLATIMIDPDTFATSALMLSSLTAASKCLQRVGEMSRSDLGPDDQELALHRTEFLEVKEKFLLTIQEQLRGLKPHRERRKLERELAGVPAEDDKLMTSAGADQAETPPHPL
jgi:hypothetical protein